MLRSYSSGKSKKGNFVYKYTIYTNTTSTWKNTTTKEPNKAIIATNQIYKSDKQLLNYT